VAGGAGAAGRRAAAGEEVSGGQVANLPPGIGKLGNLPPRGALFMSWRSRKRLLVPEGVQTSAMDFGPALLPALLGGFGIKASYGRLREACQTDVDGPSIDTLEAVARELGLDAEQVMLPADHLLLSEAQALPALLVTRQPGGMTHFVLAWGRLGSLVQVMDPAVGRRWVRAQQLLRDVFVHQQR